MRSRPSRRPCRSPRPLVLEVLEGRCLPSTVTNLNDSGAGSLRQAIIDTPPTGTVDFQDGLTGTITLTSATLTINKILTIQGPGADLITVSGNHARQVFNIQSPFSVTISGLTIANATAGDAGTGIANGGRLALSDCIISGNTSLDGAGGGIYNTGNLTLTGSTITGNVATFNGAGGGIYNTGFLAVSDSNISNNSAGSEAGGGIWSSGTLIVTNSIITGNSTSNGGGGGIYNIGNLSVTGSTFGTNVANGAVGGGGVYNSATATIADSSFNFNSTTTTGGGILNVNAGSLSVNRDTFNGNSASGNGGGISDAGTGNSDTINNSTFYLNAAANGAGLAYSGTGALTLMQSTLSNDFASNQAGGVFHSGTGRLLVDDTIVAGNNAFGTSVDLSGAIVSQGYNLIGNGTGGTGFDVTDLVGTADTPIDPMLGPLQDNGGPTYTMALLPGSAALNAGDPGSLGNLDQRSVPRTGGVNIGAFQASASAFDVTAPDVTQADTPFDVTVTAVDIYKNVAVGYTGTVTFSTTDSDPGVVLPSDYTFTLADGGMHTFTNTGVGESTLFTAGDQTITVMDTADSTITGTAIVTVSGVAPGPRREQRGDGARTSRESAGADRFFAALREDDFAYFGPLRHDRRGTIPGMDWLGEGDALAP